jgi:pyruvate, water dikinase
MEKLLLKGVGASAGVAEGVAYLLESGGDMSGFSEGDILVTTITDPTMVKAMTKAAAIVTDIGGITSHPAILSREMGIPCVVNTREATKQIVTGMRLSVNGTTGEVYELD